MKKAIVILSGGLDSTVLTYWLKYNGYDLQAISFYYGQRHSRELECAKRTCEKLNIPFKLLNISQAMNQLDSKSVLLNQESELPKEHYTHENQKQTVVPNRNMIMISFAVGFAEVNQIEKVFYAAHKNDYTIYPDCRKEFVYPLSQASKKATYTGVRVLAPFTNKLKSDLVAIGNKLKVPFEDTWSCYTGEELPCGRCATCQERLEAFKKNNLKDSLTYQNG